MANINISSFKSNFEKGGARPNLFQVQIAHDDLDEKLTFTCRAASVPEMTVGNIDVPFQGRKVKVAGDRTFAEWQITVLNDEDWKVRSSMERWNNKLNLHEANVRIEDYNLDDYKADILVNHLAKDGSIIAVYTLVGAYPSVVAASELAWDTNDTIEEFAVTFQYDYFLRSVPVEKAVI